MSDLTPHTDDLADARNRLASYLTCSQCGERLTYRACGPTHALLAASPEQHKAVAVMFADAEQRGRAEVEAERDRLRRGGEELGKTLVFWLDLAKKVTDSDDVIEEDGDGDWGVVAERLAALGGDDR